MSSQPDSWYIPGEGNQPAGHLTAEQLFQWWQAGRLSADAVCWREGMPQWLPLSQAEPFASAICRAANTAQDQAAPPSSSIQGPPPLRGRSPFLSPRLFGSLIVVSIIGVLAAVLCVVLSQGGNGHSSNGSKGSRNGVRGDAAALADIIADYATRLKATHNCPKTDIQRQEAVAAAVEELKARVGKCGSVAFTGQVAEIIPEGPKYGGSFRWETRDRWGITMSLPQDFETVVRDGACTFGSKVWVELEKDDALSIQKGDPITIRGAVSYIQGSVLLAKDCIDIQVWPNSEQSVVKGLGLGNLGSPHTIVVPVSGSVACSVGRFKSLRVHTYFGE